MITRRQVESLAARFTFRVDAVEKVLRLAGILRRLDRHEGARGAWALKGGTALNLFYLDVPRLSVDLDINFIGTEGVEALPAARDTFERILASCCEREGCMVHRTPREHAGGKTRLRFESVLGGTQNLAVDVNYVCRVPLFDVQRRPVVLPLPDGILETPLLALEELAAGKFAALLARAEARDFFDAASLLDLLPGLIGTTGFRIAFVCQGVASRVDFRKIEDPLATLTPRNVERRLLPLLRVQPGTPPPDPESMARDLRERLHGALGNLLAWRPGERCFIDEFLEGGQIHPEHLTGDPGLQDRVRKQPMLLWKQRHILQQHR